MTKELESESDEAEGFPLAIVGGLIAVVAAAAVAGYLIFSKALVEQSTYVGAASYGVTVFSTGVSLGGFAFTLWQLARTRKAASAATRSVKRIKRHFGSFDVLLEVRTARATAAESQKHVQGGRWELAAVSYNVIRSSLAKMVAVSGGLSEDETEKAKDHLASVLEALRTFEKITPETGELIDKASFNDRMRELDGFLIGLEYKVKDTFDAS